MSIRVICWGAGHTGCMVIRALQERPQYRIVAGFVYSDEKHGRDLGTLAGIAPIGVTATNDRQRIIDTPADCVLYLASAEKDVPASIVDIWHLLASGKDVISTSAGLIYTKALPPEAQAALAAACKKGQSTYHPLGLSPGLLAETVPLFLLRMARKVDRLVCSEVLNYDRYPGVFQMRDLLGFGFAPDDPTPIFDNVELAGDVWRLSGLMLADIIGLTIDRIEPFRETVVTPHDIDTACGLIKAGTVGAMNFGARVICDGRERMVLQHYTRMASDLAPHWPHGHGWLIDMEGDPTITARIEMGSASADPADDACMATAMHAINAMPYVLQEKAGILPLTDAPPIAGIDSFHIA